MEVFKRPEGCLGGRTPDTSGRLDAEIQNEMKTLEEGSARYRREHPGTARTIESWIENIDFKTLRGVFEDYAKRSGVEVSRLNMVDPGRIFITALPQTPPLSQHYDAGNNAIAIDGNLAARKFSSSSEAEQRIMKADFVHRLFHEYTHGTGVVDLTHRRTLHSPQGTIDSSATIGYTDLVRVTPAKTDGTELEDYQDVAFQLLNEGITERLTDEVFLEYFRRHSSEGHRTADGENAAERYVQLALKTDEDYNVARRFVGALVGTIAERSGVPEESVWRAFVRQYYSGELNTSHVDELLGKTFGENFVEKLAFGKTGTDLLRLVASDPELQAHYDTAVERWARHLQLTRGAR